MKTNWLYIFSLILAFPMLGHSSAAQREYDSHQLTNLITKSNNALQGNCTPPGTSEEERVFQCVLGRNKIYIEGHLTRLKAEIADIEKQNALISASSPTAGLDYKGWVLQDNNYKIEDKKRSLEYYEAALLELTCGDFAKFGDMPLFENFDQMSTYLKEKSKISIVGQKRPLAIAALKITHSKERREVSQNLSREKIAEIESSMAGSITLQKHSRIESHSQN